MKLTDFLKPYKVNIVLAPFFKLLEAILELITPIVVARIIDEGILKENMSFIYIQGLIMIAIAVFGLIFALLCQYIASITSQKIGTDLRNAIMHNYLNYPSSKTDTLSAATVNSRIVNDTHNLQHAVAMSMRLLTRSPFLVIGATFSAFFVSPSLAPIFLVCTVLIGVLIYFVMTRSSRLYSKAAESSDSLIGKVKENVNGARIVKAAGKVENELERANNDVAFIRKNILSANKISAALNPVTFLIINSALVLLVYLGKTQIENLSLEIGQLIALTNYMTQILLSLLVIAYIAAIFSRASASAKRVRPLVIKYDNNKENLSSEPRFNENAAILECKELAFKYDSNSSYSIKDVNFCLNKGESLGIVGSTASGKSTIVNLLGGLYSASSGSIYLKGVNIDQIPVSKLHSEISITPQVASLIPARTLKDNLNWRDKTVSDSKLLEILDTVNAKDFVLNKEEGLNTIITSGGKNFSGGQRQRLSLARALVGSFSLFVVDDSLSALDALTQAEVSNAILKLDCAKIIVSQRSQAVMHLDKILCLEAGEVVGFGSHEELLNNCPVYKEIHNSNIRREK